MSGDSYLIDVTPEFNKGKHSQGKLTPKKCELFDFGMTDCREKFRTFLKGQIYYPN